MQHRECSLYRWAFIFCSYLLLGRSRNCSACPFYQQGTRVGGERGKCLLDEHVSVNFGSKMLSSTECTSKTTQHPAGRGAACVGCAGSGDRYSPSQLVGSVLQDWHPTKTEFPSWESAKQFIISTRAQNTHRFP